MGSPALHSMELEVEQTAEGEPADGELPVEVYSSTTAAATKEDHMAGLQANCRPSGTWVESPQKDLERLSCPSSLPLWHEWHPPARWPHS
jgi:hypothetical protein